MIAKIQPKEENIMQSLVASIFDQFQHGLKNTAFSADYANLMFKFFFDPSIFRVLNSFSHFYASIIRSLNTKAGDVWVHIQIPPRVV